MPHPSESRCSPHHPYPWWQGLLQSHRSEREAWRHHDLPYYFHGPAYPGPGSADPGCSFRGGPPRPEAAGRGPGPAKHELLWEQASLRCPVWRPKGQIREGCRERALRTLPPAPPLHVCPAAPRPPVQKLQAGAPALQSMSYGGTRQAWVVLCGDRRDRSGKVFGTLRTVAYHHQFISRHYLLGHLNVDRLLPLYGNLKALITDIGENQHFTLLHHQAECTLKAGGGAAACALYHDRHTRKRFACM